MAIASLAFKSFRNRKFAAGLAITSIMLSVALLFGVEILRNEAKTSFTSTISGTDLIVGARTSSAHLLLFSVFGIGMPTNNLSWSSYREISQHPEVAWSIPISMGDSHRGFRVLGTNHSYFEHYLYSRDRKLSMAQGNWFKQDNEVVLGAESAATLGYRVGDEVIVAHGAGVESFVTHNDDPFRVSGILSRTGTPVDRALFIDLDGFDGLHDDWRFGGQQSVPKSHDSDHGEHDGDDELADDDHANRNISAFLLGLKSRPAALFLQRDINQFDHEPLSAILPGFTLLELWEIVGLVENTLLAISTFVVVVGLFSMLIILMTSINERRREMSILRAAGARPAYIFFLILGEALFITVSGIALAALLVTAAIHLAQDWVATELGLFVSIDWFSINQFYIVLLVAMAGCLIGIVPGVRIYRYSLVDGLSIRT